MTIVNLGSINADLVYRLQRFPESGETIAADNRTQGLGGKGANQSVAIACAGGDVRHIGCVGEDGEWLVSALRSRGVDVDHIATLGGASGHAVIYVDASAENSIVLYEGTNRRLAVNQITSALTKCGSGDWLVAQNETNLVPEAAQQARASGLKVAYSAAPFDAAAVAEVLPHIDLLAVNEVEYAQLQQAKAISDDALAEVDLLITKGGAGAVYKERSTGSEFAVSAHQVDVVDTTGAGDTFFGFFISAIAQGDGFHHALHFASAASAIQITRHGAADAIPDKTEVEMFMKTHQLEETGVAR